MPGLMEADAASKLKELQGALDKSKTTERDELAQHVNKLQASYDKEKKAALAEWAAAKKKLEKSADDRLAAATKQLEKLQGQTASQLAQLESNLNDATSSRDQAKAELENAVKQLNSNFPETVLLDSLSTVAEGRCVRN